MRCFWVAFLAVCAAFAADTTERLKLRISWGEQAPAASDYYIKLVPASAAMRVESTKGVSLEVGEGLKDGAWKSRAGGNDIDGVDVILAGSEPEDDVLQNVHVIWSDLISGADPDTARRLSNDAAMHPKSPRLTIQMNADGTHGFTVTMSQLRAEKALWIPSLHVFLTAGEEPISFSQYRAQSKKWEGQRILSRVSREPEASYKTYTSLWEDMGNPRYSNPEQRGPGHIIGVTWDSAIPKFGIDRSAGVWNDYGNPDHFQFWFDFANPAKGINDSWKAQRLENGLPVVTTVFEKDGARFEVEQFAYPLEGPPRERRGDLKMVLLQRLRVTDITGKARTLPISFTHRRAIKSGDSVVLSQEGETAVFQDAAQREILLAVSGLSEELGWHGTTDYQKELKRIDGTFPAKLAANGSREFIFKLASPIAPAESASKLKGIDYVKARQETIRFWSDYISRGARFAVPEKAVNEMFNASLWHALRLPRRHGGPEPDVDIDLPYSNFAYSQTGTPWPVNQSVYVDYMLYDLRGYHGISTEELAVQYRNNQESNGHVKGYANWVVYTPGMLYSVAQSYLLSGDRTSLERLMPASLKALDWCLDQIRRAQHNDGSVRGLVAGPLNDLTGEGVWAFNQAYIYAGLERFGRVLKSIGNPRADEAIGAAKSMRSAIESGFGAATMRSPLVQLRDHTWQPYVPVEAKTYRRILDQWYPTDVDTGAVHMIRLKAIASESPLSDWLLNDHEDNLFYKGLGIANEPVYNQHATAYLLRDEPEAVIRTFYSLMASGFSHSVFEPVEHRWTHGQYFGPPSTDGAWFELYRNMLIHERDDDALVLCLAAPRAWFADQKKIQIDRAPTYYGPLSMNIESSPASGRIAAHIEMPQRSRPAELFVRLRHPDGRRIRSVMLNGRNWSDFDPAKEWVRIPKPDQLRYEIVASY